MIAPRVRRRPLPSVGALLLSIAIAVPACGDEDTKLATRSTTTVARPTTTTSTTAVPVLPSTTVAIAPAAGAAATPETVAQQIMAAETAVRDPAIAPAQLAVAGHTQQVAYRTLSENPSWQSRVLAATPEAFHRAIDANAEAAAKLRTLVGKPRTELPQWRIVDPAPAGELLGYYQEAEATYGVPWAYLAGIHLVETRMGRIRGISEAGAQGPMQFLPSTWSQYGEGGDINSNRDSIMAAARYLKRNGAPGDMPNALFNYNRSQLYVRAITNYAEQMLSVPRQFYGYYHWQVYYLMVDGWRHLPVGWQHPES